MVPGLNPGSAQCLFFIFVGRDAWEPGERHIRLAPKGCFAAIEGKRRCCSRKWNICTRNVLRENRGWREVGKKVLEKEFGQSLYRELLRRPWMKSLVGKFRWRAWRESSEVELRWRAGTELGKSLERSWRESLYGEVGWRGWMENLKGDIRQRS